MVENPRRQYEEGEGRRRVEMESPRVHLLKFVRTREYYEKEWFVVVLEYYDELCRR